MLSRATYLVSKRPAGNGNGLTETALYIIGGHRIEMKAEGHKLEENERQCLYHNQQWLL